MLQIIDASGGSTNIVKGHLPSADLRYWEEDNNSHSTLILAAIKG